MKDVREALMVAHTSDGKLVRRPLSPHLQVYRWPITMATSILHRASGCALAVGSLLLVWWLVAAASGPAAFAGVQWFMSSILGFLVLFGWTVALFFHLCSGLRHLVWDTGHGFDKVSANSGSYAVLVATAVLTILTWIVGLVIY